jgi:SAM-dependent methyltransferase
MLVMHRHPAFDRYRESYPRRSELHQNCYSRDGDEQTCSRAWPFWAPTSADEICNAISLANIQPGERFLDLGCGDGRVLEAAAKAGAIVTGVDLNTELLRQARSRLRGWESTANIRYQNVFSASLDTDIIYAFLAPSSLQRLAPRFMALGNSVRLVTAWFQMPEWIPADKRGNCFLYRPPCQTRPTSDLPFAGIAWLLPSVGKTLASISLLHPPGPVHVQISAELARFVSIEVGADFLKRLSSVVVDLVWAPQPAGTVLSGLLSVPNFSVHQIFGCYGTANRGELRLDVEGCRMFVEALEATGKR